jgi:hypothetical protein
VHYRGLVKRVVLAVLGAVLGLLGLGVLAAGTILLAMFGTDGRTSVPIGAVSAPQGRAVVVTDFEISSSTPVPVDSSWFALQLQVTGGPHFVGVAPKTDSLRYLQGVPYDLVTGFDSSRGVVSATTIPGDRRPEPAVDQGFWADQQSGDDVVVDWPVSDADTTLVIMNENGSRGVAGDVTVLLTIAWAGAVGIGAAAAGLVLMIVAVILLVMAMRSRDDSRPGPA